MANGASSMARDLKELSPCAVTTFHMPEYMNPRCTEAGLAANSEPDTAGKHTVCST